MRCRQRQRNQRSGDSLQVPTEPESRPHIVSESGPAVAHLNVGSLDGVYVVLVPRDGALVAGQPVSVTVARRQTIDTGGALPVAITVPALLAGALVIRRARKRLLRRG